MKARLRFRVEATTELLFLGAKAPLILAHVGKKKK